MADQLERANKTLNEQLLEQCGSGGASQVLMAAAQRAAEIGKTLGGGDELGGMRVTVNPKQRKALEKELGALQHPNTEPNPNPNPNPDPDPTPHQASCRRSTAAGWRRLPRWRPRGAIWSRRDNPNPNPNP